MKARSTAHEAKLADLNDVEARRRTAADLLAVQQRELAGLGAPQEINSRRRSELIRMYGERSDCLEGQCREVTKLSGGLLQAEMRRGHGLVDVEVKFRAVAAGSNVRGAKFDDFFRNIRTDSDPLTTWEVVLTELETLLLAGADKQIPSEQTPNLTRLGISEADQRRIQQKLSTDRWLDLALTRVRCEADSWSPAGPRLAFAGKRRALALHGTVEALRHRDGRKCLRSERWAASGTRG